MPRRRVLIVVTLLTLSVVLGSRAQANPQFKDVDFPKTSGVQIPSVKFAPAVTYGSGGTYTDCVVVADFNGDGHPDLVVVNDGSSSVDVLIGNGNGTFRAAVSYYSGGYANWVAVADVNGDGYLDLVVANTTSIAVLLGNGNGTFRAPISSSTGGSFVAVADVNGDGHPDLVVPIAAGPNAYQVSVLLGNGDGTFQAPANYNSGGWYGSSVVVTDVNGDGKPDLVVANLCESEDDCDNGEVGILLGSGDGTFQAPYSYNSGGYYAQSVAVGDFNGDGRIDLAVSNSACLANCIDGHGVVSLLLGNGNGTFQAATTYDSGGRAAGSIAIADVNADGYLDVVVANSCPMKACGNSILAALLGNGDGTLQSAVTFHAGGSYASSLVVADVNADGRPDAIVANGCNKGKKCASGVVGVLLNKTKSR